MIIRFILIFVAVPLIEIGLLIEVGRHIGTFETVAVVVLTGIAGAMLVRVQGLAVLEKIKYDIENGSLPADSLVEGLIILIAGIMLLTPGFLTDIFGLILLIPFSRVLVKEKIVSLIRSSIRSKNLDIYYDSDL